MDDDDVLATLFKKCKLLANYFDTHIACIKRLFDFASRRAPAGGAYAPQVEVKTRMAKRHNANPTYSQQFDSDQRVLN